MSGLGAVVIAWRIGARDGRLTGILTAIVFALSFPLAYCSSEARGYAPAVCLTLLALWWLLRYCDTQRSSDAAGFWVCSVLAMTAHASFLLAFIGMLLWTDSHAERITGSVRQATRITLHAFVVPGIAIGVFYLVSLRGMTIGGGPPYSLVEVAMQTLSLMVGGAIDAADGLDRRGSRRRRVRCRGLMAEGPSGPPMAPVCRLLPGRTRVVYPVDPATRVDAALSADPGGVGAAAALSVARISIQPPGGSRAFAIALLALYVTGNTVHLTKFASTGRGHYHEALTDIMETAPREPVTVRSRSEARGAVSDRAGGQLLRRGARAGPHPALRSSGACQRRFHHPRGARRR